MVREIHAAQLERKLANGEHIVILEASPAAEFDRGHLETAILPAPDRIPSKSTQVVVYGQGAASVLETLGSLGFTELFHYPGGKEDWASRGLTLETASCPAFIPSRLTRLRKFDETLGYTQRYD